MAVAGGDTLNGVVWNGSGRVPENNVVCVVLGNLCEPLLLAS